MRGNADTSSAQHGDRSSKNCDTGCHAAADNRTGRSQTACNARGAKADNRASKKQRCKTGCAANTGAQRTG